MMARDVFAPAASDYFYKNKPRRFIAESLLNIFPFERSGNFLKGLKICEELMKQGKSIMLFPEGTRSTQENIGEFKPGIGMLSIELGIPIIPVYIKGAHDALGKGSYFIKPRKIELMIGKPIDPKGIEKGYNGYKELARLTKKEIEKISAS
jgi:long-chain acyl-CoA synthetase